MGPVKRGLLVSLVFTVKRQKRPPTEFSKKKKINLQVTKQKLKDHIALKQLMSTPGEVKGRLLTFLDKVLHRGRKEETCSSTVSVFTRQNK